MEFTTDIKDIEGIISKGNDFAVYRLPLQTICHFITHQKPAEVVDSLSFLSYKKGFFISPFVTDGSKKMLLISGEELCFKLPAVREKVRIAYKMLEEKSTYLYDFDQFSFALRKNILDKVVLARKAFVQMTYSATDIFQLFLKACQLYPRNFVALWRTARGGTWLVASPELFLEQEGETYRTMALAGTRSIKESSINELKGWDAKNRHEQELVANYISGILNEKGEIVRSVGPYPSQSGELLHLRTDFDFQTNLSVGEILQSLHPTPAVCGFPKSIAYEKIVSFESIDREYYAGFCGPLNIKGCSGLYVTLRCMKFVPKGAYAYAGGGLLRESIASEEWNETCRKIETLLKILD